MANQALTPNFASFGILLLIGIVDVESADFYGAFADNRILSPNFKQISGPSVTKLDCAQLCAGTVDCDAYNFIPPQVVGANAVCQFVKIGFNTSAVYGGPGAEVWFSKTSSSDFVRTRLLRDRKVYTVINQQVQPFTTADTHCARMGGRVAGPTSIAKFNAFVEALNGMSFAYMGMKDTAIQGLFVDDKGNSYPWNLNFPNEPGALGPQEDCLQTWDTVPNGMVGWMIGDNMCNVNGSYICELPRTQNVKDIGCYEIPPKPEGAVYQNWDGFSFPLPVGATVTSACKPGWIFHTGISVYSAICGADGYWTRPNASVPFCTGTLGYLTNGTNCFKLLQEATVFASSAQARCQRMGGNVLTFTTATDSIFKSLLLFPQGSPATQGKVIAGYSDAAMEGSWKDAQGNLMPTNVWQSGQPNGGTAENYAYVWYSSPSAAGVVFDDTDLNLDKAKLICVFSNC